MTQERPIRMTPQRLIILEELGKSHNHPTADQIYESVRRRLPRISLGPVYRNLDILASHGMIQKLEMGGNQRRFEVNPEMHYHVLCLQCGAIADVSLKSPSPFTDMLTTAADFDIFGIRLEFLGLCPKCKQKRRTA